MYDHRVDHATQIQTAVETAQLSSITQLSGSLKLYLTMKTNALKWGSEGEHAYNDHAGVITVAFITQICTCNTCTAMDALCLYV